MQMAIPTTARPYLVFNQEGMWEWFGGTLWIMIK